MSDRKKVQISILKNTIEETLGKTFKTPKDFEYLSKAIFLRLRTNVSSTTYSVINHNQNLIRHNKSISYLRKRLHAMSCNPTKK